MQAATGAGKTVMASNMLATCEAKGFRGFFICHRQELVDQTGKTFRKNDMPYGFIASGMRADYTQPIQICSIDTLKNRLDQVPKPNLVIWDEAHHISANGWANTKAYFGEAKHIGLSATPERLDGRGLGEHFDMMVLGPEMSWLIDQGNLAHYDYLAPSIPDMSGVHTQMGDFKKGEAEMVMEGSKIIGDIVEHYQKYARGKRTIAFAVNVKHSIKMVEAFKQAGIRAIHLDGETRKADRKLAAQAFARGDIDVIWNVDLFGEGYDLAAQAEMDVTVDCVISARPTQSTGLYLQQVGRALRPKTDGSKAVILDHAGNVFRHGLPDMERTWSLEGRQKGQRRKKLDPDDLMIKQCPACFLVHTAAPVCPFCGHVHKVNKREIKEEEGNLEMIDADALKAQMRRQQGQAKTIEDLVATGMGESQARHIVAAREVKNQLRTDLYNIWTAAYTARLTPTKPIVSEIRRMKPKELKERISEFNRLVA
jgi:superfamily II DNA or RNA helicase